MYFFIKTLQLSRQKHALAEELLNTRRELEKIQVVVERLIKDKEILTQDKAELIVQVLSQFLIYCFMCVDKP